MARRLIGFIATVSTSMLLGAAGLWHMLRTAEPDYEWEHTTDEGESAE